MFTGLVEEMGTLRQIEAGRQSITLTIGCSTILSDTQIGDSISIDGVCLTAVEVTDSSFTVQAVAETLQRTALGQRRVGDQVNLERTLAAGQRFGGHFVQGHVDGVGTVDKLTEEGDSIRMAFSAPPNVQRYIVEKGSVAVDGVSLTVADVLPDGFTVALIPHTLQVTTLGQRQPGHLVNLEADILGKYVDHLLQQREEVPNNGR